MTTSAVLSALRVAGRQHISASTLGARPQYATGSHIFRIPRFTHVREKVANGAAVMSSPFSVGGHDWRIRCYPNGDDEEDKGCISLYLRHASHDKTGEAIASFSLSLLDKASKPTRTRTTIRQRHFTGGHWGERWGNSGWRKFIKLQDLDEEEKQLLEDDCLSVLCDVTVDLGLHPDEYTDEAAAADDLAKAPPPFDLHGLAEAIWNRQEADVKIVVGGDGHTFAAHRWVLEARSPVFNADLAALASSDATTIAELRVADMDADVCKALLQFIYTDSPPPQLAAMAERLLVAADRYKLEELKLVCEEALCAEELVKAPPPFALHGLAQDLWNTREADVKIVVGGDGHTTFSAHRWLLESRSPVFKADLAVASSDATAVAELRVDDMDADVCKALLQFIYTDSPPPQLGATAEPLLVAADRYELEHLKLMCEEELCKDIGTSSVADALVLADRDGCPALREVCMRFLASPGNLDEVLASPHGLAKLKTGCPSALVELLMKKEKTPPRN